MSTHDRTDAPHQVSHTEYPHYPALKAAVEKFVADDYRSITSLIEKLLVEHLQKHGYLSKPAKK